MPNLAHGASSTNNAIPSSLQVTVGGNLVPVTGFVPYAYPSQSPPFPLQALTYTIPSGTASADVTVTSSSGSATAHGALTYFPAIQQFPLPGAALAQGIYDPYLDVYFFSDANKIQVFSRTQGKWLTPISIPGPAGASQRLWGISLSPDGTKLAVADATARVIYLLDPSSPSSVQMFQVPTVPNVPGAITNACGVAVSNAGIVSYAAVVQGGSGFTQFFKLDTITGAVTPYSDTAKPNTPTTDVYLRTEITSDNCRVFFNAQGGVFSIDTATDAITPASVDPACCYGDYELTLSGNQTQFEAASYLYNVNLEAESYYALNDREILNIAYVRMCMVPS